MVLGVKGREGDSKSSGLGPGQTECVHRPGLYTVIFIPLGVEDRRVKIMGESWLDFKFCY